MAYVIKGNKQLNIPQEKVNDFLARGFAQIDEKGKLIKEATGGFNPTIADMRAKDAEIAKLNAEIAKLKSKEDKKNKGKDSEDKGGTETN